MNDNTTTQLIAQEGEVVVYEETSLLPKSYRPEYLACWVADRLKDTLYFSVGYVISNTIRGLTHLGEGRFSETLTDLTVVSIATVLLLPRIRDSISRNMKNPDRIVLQLGKYSVTEEALAQTLIGAIPSAVVGALIGRLSADAGFSPAAQLLLLLRR
jgi:hypothetical protein